MSKLTILGVGFACLFSAVAVSADNTQTVEKAGKEKIEERRVQKWEFHGCAAIPIIAEATAKSGKKPILKMAREQKEAAKTR